MTGLAVASPAAVGHGGAAFWYLTRSTGLVSLLLLSATVVLGLVSAIGWTGKAWPRFVSQGLHRNLSLLCIVLVAVHVVTTVADGYVPIGVADAVVPFASPYRPVWVGLGAAAFDLLAAVAISSALRHRVGFRTWRGVHWLAYLCWPVAVLHGLGSGSDTRLSAGIVVYVLCVLAVAGSFAWRLVTVSPPAGRWRAMAAIGGLAVVVGVAAFAVRAGVRPGSASSPGALPTSGTPTSATPTSSTPTSGTAALDVAGAAGSMTVPGSSEP